jgi:hypothetical protein
MQSLIQALAKSHYSHFKKEAQTWRGKENQISKIRKRIDRVSLEGELLIDMSINDLQVKADGLASEIIRRKSSPLAKKLADVNLVIWSKRTSWFR